jgi:hypothetical protein
MIEHLRVSLLVQLLGTPGLVPERRIWLRWGPLTPLTDTRQPRRRPGHSTTRLRPGYDEEEVDAGPSWPRCSAAATLVAA